MGTPPRNCESAPLSRSFLSPSLARNTRQWRATPGAESLLREVEDGLPILRNHFHPGEAAHLREINSPETEPRDKDVDAITERLVIERIHRLFDCLGTVRASPPDSYLAMSFIDAHLQWRVRHRKGNELLPVLRTRQPPRGFQPFVERSRRQWRHHTKDRQPRRPSANLLESSFCHARRVIVHAKDKRGDGKNVAPGEPIEHHSIFTWLIEAFFYVSKVGRIDGFHSDEDPLASCGRDQINELLIAQQIGADLGDPMHLRVSGDDVSQQ